MEWQRKDTFKNSECYKGKEYMSGYSENWIRESKMNLRHGELCKMDWAQWIWRSVLLPLTHRLYYFKCRISEKGFLEFYCYFRWETNQIPKTSLFLGNTKIFYRNTSFIAKEHGQKCDSKGWLETDKDLLSYNSKSCQGHFMFKCWWDSQPEFSDVSQHYLVQ